MAKKQFQNKKTNPKKTVGTKSSNSIEIEGKVLEVIPGGQFKVEIAGGHIVQAHRSGKIRMNYIQILPGDTVTLELSEYDLTKGRIIWRKL